jgi:hypothetical protein
MIESTITFDTEKYHYLWIMHHNLEEHNIGIQAAAVSFLLRVQEDSPEPDPLDFCEYVTSKNPANFKCIFIHEQRLTN